MQINNLILTFGGQMEDPVSNINQQSQKLVLSYRKSSDQVGDLRSETPLSKTFSPVASEIDEDNLNYLNKLVRILKSVQKIVRSDRTESQKIQDIENILDQRSAEFIVISGDLHSVQTIDLSDDGRPGKMETKESSELECEERGTFDFGSLNNESQEGLGLSIQEEENFKITSFNKKQIEKQKQKCQYPNFTDQAVMSLYNREGEKKNQNLNMMRIQKKDLSQSCLCESKISELLVQLRVQNKVLKERIGQLQVEIKYLSVSSQECSQSLKEKKEELNRILRSYQNLIESVQGYKSQLKDSRKQFLKIKVQLQLKINELTQKNGQIKTLKSNNQMLELRVHQMENKNKQMLRQSNQVEAEIVAKWKQIEKVHSLVLVLKQESEKLKEENLQLTKVIQETNERHTLKETASRKTQIELQERNELITNSLLMKMSRKDQEINRIKAQMTSMQDSFHLSYQKLKNNLKQAQMTLIIQREERDKLHRVFQDTCLPIQAFLETSCKSELIEELRKRLLCLLGQKEQFERDRSLARFVAVLREQKNYFSIEERKSLIEKVTLILQS